MIKNNISGLLRTKDVYLYILMCAFAAISFNFSFLIGGIELGLIIIVFLFQFIFNKNRNKKISEYIEDLFVSSDSITKDFVVNCVLPLAIMKDDLNIIWYNNKFADIFYDDGPADPAIKSIIKNFPQLKTKKASNEIESFVVSFNDSFYNVKGNRLKISGTNGKFYSLLYFVDVTNEVNLEKKTEERELAFAKIVIDNFEEALSGLSEAQRAVLIAETDKHIYNWAQESDAVVKKQERDNYFMFFEKKHLDSYIKQGFEKLRDISLDEVDANVRLTLSVGIGIGGDNPSMNEDFSNASIDMALGRGGDQIVIKDKKGFSFYGGAAKETEKRSKVRSRVVAHALKELIESNENVIIMGHADPDMDALGSALGIARTVKNLGKQSYILIEDNTPSVKDLRVKMAEDPEYDDIFINSYQAEGLLNESGMLVIVDVHRKMLLPYPEIVDMAKTIVIIDHHRKSTDFIDTATLTYHEPYASSTAELVIEIIQYMKEKQKLTALECQALYAGMIIDTKNFTYKTGVRTFEAASYLRRSGLDTAEARDLVKCDLASYRLKNKIIDEARIYRDKIAIAKYEGPKINDPTIIAMAADELINIKDIETTFVIYKEGNYAKISARSIGSINVQIIMEKMGGGGHQLSAGARVDEEDINVVLQRLITCIDEYLDENGL